MEHLQILGQFPGGEYPLGQDWTYTIGARRSARRGRAAQSRLGQDWTYTIGRSFAGFGNMDPYTIGNPRPFRVNRRRSFRGLLGFGALGDDTPDSIRIYVPRLAASLYAIDLQETGLTQEAMPPVAPIETARWNDGLKMKFIGEVRKIVGFVPVVHEPEGADVIFAHMVGATSHAEAEAIWAPIQARFTSARNATGVAAPADPYAGTPRAWEAPRPPVGPPVTPPVAPRVLKGSIWELLAGMALTVGGIVLL